ncbi:hypothetical protein B0H13DRAFT_2672167 [Mycena leptocephala]|nr:hypothetical protein B0H13DRAFT_2672167 [Mycena leptocephala]
MTSLLLCQQPAACQRGIDARLVLHLVRTWARAHERANSTCIPTSRHITAESAGERAVQCGFLVARCVCIAWWGAHQERGAKNSKDVAGRHKVKPCPNIPITDKRSKIKRRRPSSSQPPALHHDLATSNNSEHKQATTPMPHKGHRARVPARYHLFSLDTHYFTPHDLSSLRVLGSVGEPFNPRRGTGTTSTQTETDSLFEVITPFSGAVCVSTKPGGASATVPFFGHVPAILDPITVVGGGV